MSQLSREDERRLEALRLAIDWVGSQPYATAADITTVAAEFKRFVCTGKPPEATA